MAEIILVIYLISDLLAIIGWYAISLNPPIDICWTFMVAVHNVPLLFLHYQGIKGVQVDDLKVDGSLYQKRNRLISLFPSVMILYMMVGKERYILFLSSFLPSRHSLVFWSRCWLLYFERGSVLCILFKSFINLFNHAASKCEFWEQVECFE